MPALFDSSEVSEFKSLQTRINIVNECQPYNATNIHCIVYMTRQEIHIKICLISSIKKVENNLTNRVA